MPKAPTQTASRSSENDLSAANRHPVTVITQEMILAAKRLIPATRVNRTVASEIDTLTGHLGEFVFAQYFYGDWHKHHIGKNKGKVDYGDIEIKTSAFPFSQKLHLLVREDYAQKRKPAFYVQIILAVNSRTAAEIPAGTKAYLCGFATTDEIDQAPKRDFGSKLGGKGGYRCHYICIRDLHPMTELVNAYKNAIE